MPVPGYTRAQHPSLPQQTVGTRPPGAPRSLRMDRGRLCKFAVALLWQHGGQGQAELCGCRAGEGAKLEGIQGVRMRARCGACPTWPCCEAVRAAEEAACPGECAGAGAGPAGPFWAAGYRYRQASAFTFFTT